MSRSKPALRAALALALSALALLALTGTAAAKDRNHDRIPDRWEKRHELNLKVNQAKRDQDRDGLRNRAEFLTDMDPRDRDSDDDGTDDGEEGAGTIKSFDPETGRLVIDLFADDDIAGFVDDGTRIRCEKSPDDEGATTSSSREDEPGDDHGEESGDDHGEHAEDESGDDHSDDNSGPGSESSGPGSGHEQHGDCGGTCTTDDLVAGAVVDEAEIEIQGGRAVFEEIELG